MNEPKNKPIFGRVVFLEYDEENRVFVEIGKTPVLSYRMALCIYSETPNPASQLIVGDGFGEITEKYEKLLKDMKDPIWVDELLNCI